MDRFTRETEARVKTQRMLREASTTQRECMSKYSAPEHIPPEIKKIMRKSRKQIFAFWDTLYDKTLKTHQIAKIHSHSGQRTSKHKQHTWVTLLETENAPIHLREQHIVELIGVYLDSRNPMIALPVPTSIFVSRHAIERVVMRKGASSVKEVGQHLWPLICMKSFGVSRCAPGESRVIASRDAYIATTHLRESEMPVPDMDEGSLKALDALRKEQPFLITTFVDHDSWSERNRNHLSQALDAATEIVNTHIFEDGDTVTPLEDEGLTMVLDIPEPAFRSENAIDLTDENIRCYLVGSHGNSKDQKGVAFNLRTGEVSGK